MRFPYLIEREGTINENLPETHAVLKQIRRELDAQYEGRVLLAEANQWPSDVRAYFGDGDECHMAFHFPLMPRMFMGLRQEERHPIVEIMNQTPEIPPTCQWAIFLRNHDELTLEMVTDEERDYMYAQYAADPQMRLNLGIRRRLAPLMENSRRRIELMNSLLFSMPGTPVIYYGDEIGMGDNVYLGDRNGVRTPMQWSSDRNGGFSRCDPGTTVSPGDHGPGLRLRRDQRRGAGACTVLAAALDEADDRAAQAAPRCSGADRFSSSPTANRKVLTYVRRFEDDIVLCVANLARTVQPVEIPLREFAGLTPVEMLGQTEFPRIGDQPYFLTLAPYGFYWFQLQEVVTPITARTAAAAGRADCRPCALRGRCLGFGARRQHARNHREARAGAVPRAAALVRRQGARAGPRAVRRLDHAARRRASGVSHDRRCRISATASRDRYMLPLAMSSDREARTLEEQHPGALIARITGARKGALYDGLFDDGTCATLLASIQEERTIPMRHGIVQANNIDLTPQGAPADTLVANREGGVRSEQHIGAVRSSSDHEDVPPRSSRARIPTSRSANS